MQKEEEIKKELRAYVDCLCSPVNSSIRISFPYWKARCLLRLVALNAYKEVTSKYIAEGISLDFPSDGFKFIADDYNDTMALIENNHPLEEIVEE